jgi:hypothetical protein
MNLYRPQGTGLKWVNHSSNIALPTATIVGPMKIPSRPKVCNPPTVPMLSHGLRYVLCTAAIERPVRNRKNSSPDERDHEASDQPEREPENDHRRNPARAQPIRGTTSHETDVGRSSAIRCIEAALMHQRAVKAAPRTGQLKSAAGVSRRARPRRECWAVGTLLADPWLLERDVHTVGGQVESQPARL